MWNERAGRSKLRVIGAASTRRKCGPAPWPTTSVPPSASMPRRPPVWSMWWCVSTSQRIGLPGNCARVAPTSHSDCASVTGASNTIRWSLISTTRLLCVPPWVWNTPGASCCSRRPCEPRVS